MSCDLREAYSGVLVAPQRVGAPARCGKESDGLALRSSRLVAELSVWYFRSSWFAIATISAYDAYLVMLYRNVILSVEQNPLCAMLIAWDPHDLSFFLVAKILGTMTVLGVLVVMYYWRRRWALPVITGVCVFQMGLLLYLNMAQK